MYYPNFEEAKKELLAFLEANPEMAFYQKQIESYVMQKAGDDPMKRLVALTDLMVDNLDQLKVELRLLNYKMLSLIKEPKERQ